MNILYCNTCGKRIPQADLDACSDSASEHSHVQCRDCGPRRKSSRAVQSLSGSSKSPARLAPAVGRRDSARSVRQTSRLPVVGGAIGIGFLLIAGLLVCLDGSAKRPVQAVARVKMAEARPVAASSLPAIPVPVAGVERPADRLARDVKTRVVPVSSVQPQPPTVTSEESPKPIAPCASLTGEVAAVFDFTNGRSNNWMAPQGLEPLSFSGGRLSTRTTDADAYLFVAGLKIDTSQVTHVVVRMRSSKAGKTQVYYETSTGPDLRHNSVPSVDNAGDGQWHEYAIRMAGQRNFAGELNLLRLDPANGDEAIGAEVEIEWIRLEKRSRPTVVAAP